MPGQSCGYCAIHRHGLQACSYYAYKKRLPSKRSRRDERLKVVIMRVFEQIYSVYGARKIWHAINRDYADVFGSVARCTVERLMRELGIRGIPRKGKRPATKSAPAQECPKDLVNRDFTAEEPNCLWVADIVRHEALCVQEVM